MLTDSLATGEAGTHVEQVEIVFAESIDGEKIISAWKATVAATEALRISFKFSKRNPVGSRFVSSTGRFCQEQSSPASLEAWLHTDRHRPLLVENQVPWRVTWWPCGRRFIWTFHHALLDGRSITRVIRNFLLRVIGEDVETLSLVRWQPPARQTVERARRLLTCMFSGMVEQETGQPPKATQEPAAVQYLGNTFVGKLNRLSSSAGVTMATVLTWAWGQALTGMAGAEAVMVEHIRSGPPTESMAGFGMNMLPLLIPHHSRGDVVESLRTLRHQMLALRHIEEVSSADFPVGVFPRSNGPWNSILMIERGTVAHMVGSVARQCVESLLLHEERGNFLTASAHVLPDLRLEVEGPGRQILLNRWIEELEKLVIH